MLPVGGRGWYRQNWGGHFPLPPGCQNLEGRNTPLTCTSFLTHGETEVCGREGAGSHCARWAGIRFEPKSLIFLLFLIYSHLPLLPLTMAPQPWSWPL